MKKLALLLAAMTAVSAVASAKEVVAAPVVAVEAACPELTPDQEFAIYQKVKKNYKGFRATNFGMELEVETYSQDSNNDIAALAFAGFAYRDDITLELQAAAFSSYNDEEDREFASSDARAQLSIWKKLNPMGGFNHSVGVRGRFHSGYDRYYARYKYSTGPVSGWADARYTRTTDEFGDSWSIEAMPVIFKYNGFGVGYYVYAEKGNISDAENFKHQARFYTPSYNFTDKFSVNAEYRLWLGEETKDADGNSKYGYSSDLDAAKAHTLYLNWSYDYSEVLNFYAYTGVEYGEWNFADGEDDRVYTDTGIGFNYKF